jgi:hypothetical protein
MIMTRSTSRTLESFTIPGMTAPTRPNPSAAKPKLTIAHGTRSTLLISSTIQLSLCMLIPVHWQQEPYRHRYRQTRRRRMTRIDQQGLFDDGAKAPGRDGWTYSGSTDKVYDTASDVFLIPSSLRRYTIEQRTEHVPSFTDRVHVAWDDCGFVSAWISTWYL